MGATAAPTEAAWGALDTDRAPGPAPGCPAVSGPHGHLWSRQTPGRWTPCRNKGRPLVLVH